MSTTTVLKIAYNDDLRRWNLEPSTSNTTQYQSLQKFISDSFHLYHFQLKYIDDEGDKISLSNETDLQTAINMTRKTDTSLKISVTKLETPDAATNTVNTNQKISLRIEPTDYTKSSHFGWEEAELLGFMDDETFRLELQFEQEKVASSETCIHLTGMFAFFFVPFFITLPFLYCLKRSKRIQQDLSKTVLTNERLITKNVENDICAFCCDCTQTQRIYHQSIPWDKLRVTDIKVTADCVEKCFKIKTLKIHNKDRERPAWISIVGLKDPEGIRKLLFRLRDQHKANTVRAEEKMNKVRLAMMRRAKRDKAERDKNNKLEMEKNVAVVEEIVTYPHSTWQPPQEIKMKKRKSYENEYENENEHENENEYGNEYENDYENHVEEIEEEPYVEQEPEPEPEPEIDAGGYDGGYDMNMDVGVYDMGGMGMAAPVFEFGAFM